MPGGAAAILKTWGQGPLSLLIAHRHLGDITNFWDRAKEKSMLSEGQYCKSYFVDNGNHQKLEINEE